MMRSIGDRGGYALAKADRYDEALETLDLLQYPHTARALNYRGYATRKLGRTEEGIGYYLKSRDRPELCAGARISGRSLYAARQVEAAKEELGRIEKICGSTEPEEYEDLEYAIAHNGQTKS